MVKVNAVYFLQTTEIINAILNKDGVQAFSSLADSTDSEMQRYACYGLASMTLTEDDGKDALKSSHASQLIYSRYLTWA